MFQLFVLLGCGSGASDKHEAGATDESVPVIMSDTSVSDTSVSDTSVTDTSVTDTSVTDTSVTDTGGLDTGMVPGPLIVVAPEVIPPQTLESPLTLGLTLETDAPSTLEIVVVGDGERWTFPVTAADTVHRIPLIGLLPNSLSELTVTAIGLDGGRTTWPEVFEATPPRVPSRVASFDVPVRDVERMEPGFTMLCPTPGNGLDEAYLLFLDDLGRVRWLFQVDKGAVHGLWRSERGTFVFVRGKQALVEVNGFGEELGVWLTREGLPSAGTPLDVEMFHHDVQELPDGRWAFLTAAGRTIEGYPTSEMDPFAPRETAFVVGDVVTIFDPATSVIEHSWPLLDRLDPHRIGHESVELEFWDTWFERDTRDWSHSNAVAPHPTDGSILVTVRHQDALVKLSSVGDVEWILAPEANWREPWASLVLRPTPGTTVPYHPHSGRFTAEGHVTVFDNGNGRASAFETPTPFLEQWSRGVEFTVDPVARTFTQSAEFGTDLDPRLLGITYGDVTRLPRTGNLLVTFGNLRVLPVDPNVFTRIFEVSPEGEVVWELALPVEDLARKTFRALRVPVGI